MFFSRIFHSCFSLKNNQEDGSHRYADPVKIYPLSNQNEICREYNLRKHKLKKCENLVCLEAELQYQASVNKDHEFKYLIQQLNLPHFHQKNRIAFICNQQFLILAATKTATSLTKYSFSDLIGCDLSKLINRPVEQIYSLQALQHSQFKQWIQASFFAPNIPIFTRKNRIFLVDITIFQTKRYHIVILTHKKSESIGPTTLRVFEDVFSYVPPHLIQTFQTVHYFTPELDCPLKSRGFQKAIQALALRDFNRPNEIGILCNRELKIVAVSENACNTTGYQALELIGQKITIFMDERLANIHKSTAYMAQRFLELKGCRKYWCPKSAPILFKNFKNKNTSRGDYIAVAHIFAVSNRSYFPVLLRRSIDPSGINQEIQPKIENVHVESKEDEEDSLIEIVPTSYVARRPPCDLKLIV